MLGNEFSSCDMYARARTNVYIFYGGGLVFAAVLAFSLGFFSVNSPGQIFFVLTSRRVFQTAQTVKQVNLQ